MDYYGFCKSEFSVLIWGFCYVVGLMFECEFSCGLAEWVIVRLISIEFDLLLNVGYELVLSFGENWVMRYMEF